MEKTLIGQKGDWRYRFEENCWGPKTQWRREWQTVCKNYKLMQDLMVDGMVHGVTKLQPDSRTQYDEQRMVEQQVY